MEEYKHINAEWARQQSQSIETAKVQKQLNEVLGKISIAVKTNENSVYVQNLMDVAKKEIERRGFKVTLNLGDSRDPSENDYYSVSW
jgi:hypothetical protein